MDNWTGPVVVGIDGSELRPDGAAHRIIEPSRCPVAVIPPIGGSASVDDEPG